MKTIEITDEIKMLKITDIKPNRFQPRTHFPEAPLRELSESIKQLGVLQPVCVRPADNGYELVFGEQRLRASDLAGLETVPAYIREYTDLEAAEIAITENLQRSDISAMEEAAAYKKLIETAAHDVSSIGIKVGKSETYVRNRLRLNDLIPEFIHMVWEEEITVSSAIELSKCSAEMQIKIYSDHFEDDNAWSSWRKKTAKELANNIASSYTPALSRYHFDKKDCQTCPFNSANYTLFEEDKNQASCAMISCLNIKNSEYMRQQIDSAIAQNPAAQLVIGNDSQKAVVEQLEEAGLDLVEAEYGYQNYPKPPIAPVAAEYAETSEYDSEQAKYQQEVQEYENEMAEIKSLAEQGLIKEYIKIGSNGILSCYKAIPLEAEATKNTKEADIQILENKDKRYKEIAYEKVVEDCKELVKGTMSGEISDLEEKMMYYIMLSELRTVNFKKIGIKGNNRNALTREEKTKALQKLTPNKKAVIQRDFLIAHAVRFYQEERQMLVDFTRQHFLKKLEESENKHDAVYQKRHKSLQERIAAIQVAELEV